MRSNRMCPHRAARLYEFDQRKYRKLVKEGFDFQL